MPCYGLLSCCSLVHGDAQHLLDRQVCIPICPLHVTGQLPCSETPLQYLQGRTALHEAVRHQGNDAVMECLLSKGADVNAQDANVSD